MNTSVPLVSIVVLNWNGDRHVHRCLEHVFRQSYPNIELVVVDNGSTDGSLQKIRSAHPTLIYIANHDNVGFAKGMNQGISVSKGKFVIPLNQDVCLHEAFVQRCVERSTQDDRIGAVGGRVFSWIGDELTDAIRKGEGEHAVMRKRFQVDGGNFVSDETWTWAVSGSFPFLRRDMLDDLREVSGYHYDESFVTGWEDLDLFFRMHLRGWKCLFYPKAYGWHVGSGSVGGQSTFLSKNIDYQIRILRNRYFAMIKNLPTSTLRWLLPHLIVAELLIPPYLLLHSPRSLLALFRSWKEVINALPELRVKRSRIMQGMTVPPDYLNQFFTQF